MEVRHVTVLAKYIQQILNLFRMSFKEVLELE